MRDDQEDDNLLWDAYNHNTQHLKNQSKTYHFKARSALPNNSKSSWEEAIHSMSRTKMTMHPIHRTRGVDRPLVSKIRQGKARIEASLDLHGMTQMEAHNAVLAFVQQNYMCCRKYLRIITGKGCGGIGRKGVLRRALMDWIHDEALCAYVYSVSEAPQQDGGAGAFYVVLRRRKSSELV